MSPNKTTIFIFGDQSQETTAKVRALLNAKGDPLLISFLEQSFDVIRSEVGRLPLPEREVLPRFHNLADILARQKEGALNPGFQTALTTIYQLGSFIRQHGKPGVAYPLPSETHLLGLCTGALAATAVASSKSVTDLLPIAVQTVQVAFRLGLLVVEVSNRIQPGCSGSWSLIFPGLTPGAVSVALKEFSKNYPPQSCPWISAYIANGTSVSGAPGILKELRQFGIFKGVRPLEIPVCVPGHAGHLFTSDDIKYILGTTTEVPWASFESQMPMISPVSGKLMPATNFRTQIDACLQDILTAPLRWDNINQEMPQLLKSAGVTDIELVPVMTTTENAVLQTLQTYTGGESGSPFSSVSITYIQKDELSLPQINKSGKPELSKLAIVGYSGRFPNSNTTDEFWEVLRNGIDTVRKIPIERYDVDAHMSKDGKRNTGEVQWGCFIPNAAQFDARFFSISPKEAPQIDPAQRIALMTTYEAMERAGIVPGTTPSTKTDRIGVYHGVTSNDYMETNTAQCIDTHFIVGGNRAFIPGRINFCFEFCGPSYSVDTACSSSLAAMHLACNALWRGDIDTAVSGGTNLINNPDGHTGLDRGFFLSKTGNCKTFDDGADGYCRGEGIVTTIIKRLEDALADNDPILAVINGIATNHSAESDSITRPHAPTQEALFDKVLNATGTDLNELSYIEMHGTGTQVGDAVEMESVLNVFGPDPSSTRVRRRDAPLYVGAAKSNIGHGEGVSGVTSIAKILLMYEKGIIPPHCGIRTKINHNYPLDFAERNVHIAMKETPWQRSETRPRKVLINNFSAAGGNTALLLEDGPIRRLDDSRDPEPATSYVVAISAKSANSLKGNTQAMLKYLDSPHDDDGFTLARLSYTTTARRLHHLHRVMVRGSTLQEIRANIEGAITRGDGLTRIKAPPKIVFTFTGQGSQYLGMGRQLFLTFSKFRTDIRRFDQITRGQGFPSFLHIYTAKEGDDGDFRPQVIQLAICCLQMALARLWMSWGIAPKAVVGHSLGEYAALNVAGVLSDSDTIYLVGKRAELLQEQCREGTHAMLAVKASLARVQDVLSEVRFQVACINGPDDSVLGGPVELVKGMQEALVAKNIKCTVLETSYAFHTSQVFSILGDFEAASKGVTFNKPTLPIMSPLLGSVIRDAGIVGPKYLARHCRETVNMYEALLAGQKEKLFNDKSAFMEIGPNPVVSGMVKSALGMSMLTLPTLQKNKDTWQNLTAAIQALYTQSVDFRWQEYHKDFKGAQLVLSLPAYNWDLKEYWVPYENNWCVAKPNLVMAPALVQGLPTVECTTIHKLVEESMSGQTATVVVDTDFSREDINSIAKGHMVNGIALTTPSVYAEMGLSLGKYLMARFKPEWQAAHKIVDVSDLVVEKAMIPHSKGPQVMRITASVDWAANAAKLYFRSIDKNGKATTEHGECVLCFTDDKRREEIQKRVPNIKARMKHLKEGIPAGTSLRLNQKYGYKMISCLASFHPDYRAIDEVTLDGQTLEASSTCSFGQVKSSGVFSTHPAYIDVMTQTAGFVMNAKETTDLDAEVYVNHGWKSLQIFEDLVPNKSYTTYVQMSQSTGPDTTIWEGDTIMLDGDRVVGFFEKVRLRWISRKVFHMVLDHSSGQGATKSKQTKPVAAASAKAPVTAPAKLAPIPVAPVKPKAAPVQVSVTEIPAPVKPPKQKKAKAAKKESHMEPALAIISEETGLALSDLTDDSVFSEIGVDSLLSMVITSRFREELGLDLDLEFSLFLDLPTVKHLRDFIDGPFTYGEEAEEEGENEAHGSDSEVGLVEIIQVPTQPNSTTAEQVVIHELPDPDSGAVTPPVVVSGYGSSTIPEGVLANALEIIAEESGLAVEDLTDDTQFQDVGVDSLLSMVITSRFREELGLDLDLEFSLFLDLPTVKHLRDFLEPAAPASSSTGITNTLPEWASNSEHPSTESSDWEDADLPDLDSIPPRPSAYCRPATSVILQGLPSSTSKTLFLFPDGGGSSSSYEPLPRLKASSASIIGLNCPYARDPENLRCNITDLIDSYIAEVRIRQPAGPYHLGGWSSGGIFAFLAAERLLKAGEEVKSLVIIDSPVPRVMDKLPLDFYEYCDQLGLFGYSMGAASNEPTPPWLIPHFNASVEILHGCTFPPLEIARERMPKVSIVWAGDSVLKGVKDEEMLGKLRGRVSGGAKGIHFLVEQRRDFGPSGWERMLPGAEIRTAMVEGANHFSMMHKPYISQIGEFIDGGLAD